METIRNGPGDSSHLWLLAHGTGQSMDDPALECLARGVAALGIDVLRFEFPYMQEHRAQGSQLQHVPDPDSELVACFADAAKGANHKGRVVVGGWSLGLRVAALASTRIGACGLAGVSYPWHPKSQPQERGAVDALRALNIPLCIVQGTRDAFGNREQVRGYRLPDGVALHWVEGANHALEPRPGSGRTKQQCLEVASRALGAFILGCG